MLDAVVDYLPSPLDVPPVTGIDPQTDEAAIRAADDERAVLGAGLQDRQPTRMSGRLAYFRVYSGTLQRRLLRLQLDQGQARAHRPPAADARQPPRGYRESTPATSRRSSA